MINIKKITTEEYKGNFNLTITFSDSSFQQISISPKSNKQKVARALSILAENIVRDQISGTK